MGFDIMSLQKGRGTVQARSKADEGRAVLKYIDVYDLVPSEDNFYSMSAIDELAALIELSGGVKQPALVVPLGGGKYKIIAGHRRQLASLRLVKQGKDAYRKMPCMVEGDKWEPEQEDDELRAIDEAILLITTNGQREKTDWDKVQEATRLRELLDQKRRFEKIPGETRKLIAEQLGTTPAQVGRYDSIAKHLNQYFTDLLAKGKIGISLAYDLSTLAEDLQHSAMLFHEKNGTEELKTFLIEWNKRTKELKAARTSDGKQAEPNGITMVIADEKGPAPTPEQMQELLERKKDRLPPEQPAEDRDELEDAENGKKYKPGVYVRTEPTKITTVPPDGKIVDFPAPPSSPSAPQMDDGQEETDIEWAALMLETLRNYCEVMSAVKGDSKEPWADYAEALTIAIPALRK